MARLPTPGADEDSWGTLLNEFLSVEHAADGTHETFAISKGGTGAVDAAAARTNLGAAAAADLTCKADDSTAVHNIGNETIADIKTFTSAPVVPSGAFPESAVAGLPTDLAAKVAKSGDIMTGTLSVPGGRVAPSDWFNVKSYGALGNGTTDDARAIQAAITAAQNAGGGVVFFPPGTYIVGSDPTISAAKVVLQGSGSGSIIKAKAASSVNCLKVSGANHTTIRDLQIDGNKANVNNIGIQYVLLNAIYVTGCDDILIENCYIHDHYAGGILVNSSTNLRIMHNRIENGTDNGIFLRPSPGNVGCQNATISGNITSGMSFSGIQAIRSDHLTITGNVSFNNGPTAAQGDGIGIEGCAHVTITGNAVHSNGIMGICVRGTDEGGGNLVSSHVTVAGNVCSDHTTLPGDAGIQIVDADDVQIMGNLCANNYHGIVVNKVNGALTGVTNLSLMNNQCRGNQHTGCQIGSNIGAGPFLLTDNWMAGNASDNFYTQSLVWVQGGVYASATTPGRAGIHLDTGADRSIIDGVFVLDNSSNGIFISGTCANVEVRNCVADNIVGTSQARLLYESSTAGPTRIDNCRIRSQATGDFTLQNASSAAKHNDGNSGYYDQSAGAATLSASGSSITVTHNLYKIPTRVEVTATSDAGTAIRYWVSNKTSTQFTINASPAVTNATTFDWRATTWDA